MLRILHTFKRLYKNFNIVSPKEVFNKDESGVSTGTAALGKEKAAMKAKGSSNSVELTFRANDEHATVTPVVSVDGQL